MGARNRETDRDTIASSAGQFWGTAHGLVGIPSARVRALDTLDPSAALLARWFAGEARLCAR